MRPSPFCLCGWTTDGLTELCCVVLHACRNNAPYLIKRQFASGDFVEYVEDSLMDTRNRVGFA